MSPNQQQNGFLSPPRLVESPGADSISLANGSRSSVYLKNGILDSIEMTYVMKIWNVRDYWLNFYTELYLYSHPKLLLPLQGICVPFFIGMSGAPGGRVSFAMKPPHSIGWRTASPTIPVDEKEAIVEAYNKIHAQGIEHGDVAYRHMLIGDDSTVTIIDFAKSKCVVGSHHEEEHGLVETTPESLAREMRKVKFLLDYRNARSAEYARTKDSASRPQLRTARIAEPNEDNNCPFTLLELKEWEAERDYDKRFEVRPQASCPEESPFPRRRYKPGVLELKTAPFGAAAMKAAYDITPVSVSATNHSKSTRSQTNTNKRSRSSLDDPHATKRAKVVQFHPETNDNGLWATGRPLKKIRRQSTPFIHDEEEEGSVEFVGAQGQPSSLASLFNDDIVDWGEAGRPPWNPSPTSARPSAGAESSSTERFIGEVAAIFPTEASTIDHTTQVVACPPLSVILTGETGEPSVWQVSDEVYQDVTAYLSLRMMKCLSTDGSDSASAVSKGKGKAKAGLVDDLGGEGEVVWEGVRRSQRKHIHSSLQ